jgi:uncharacterized protein
VKRKLRHWMLRKAGAPSRRELFVAWLPWLAASVALLLVGSLFVKPAPPKHVMIAAGPRDGAYYWFARRYAETFKAEGVDLQVRETAGTVENYRLLASGQADLAMTQAGAAPEGLDVELRSIASLYLEPVWVFYRGDELTTLAQLRSRRLAVGPPGSGTRAISQRLLAANDIETTVDQGATASQAGAERGAVAPAASSATLASTATLPTTRRAATVLVPLGGSAAAEALRRGDVDAAVFVISPSPMIQSLLRDDGLRLLQFHRHEAYARRFPFLSGVTLPEGVIDLGGDLPPRDVDLIAPAANLVARPGLHPTLVPLVCKAVTLAHERGDLLVRPGQFPSTAYVEWPVDPAAREYFRSGPPFLQRYLPFWVAALVDRSKILLLPLITLLLPLLRIGPPLYVWRTRSKIYRWYRILQNAELKLRAPGNGNGLAAPASTADLNAELDLVRGLESELATVKVPLSYMQEFYNLRLHADFVRRRLEERVGAEGVIA